MIALNTTSRRNYPFDDIASFTLPAWLGGQIRRSPEITGNDNDPGLNVLDMVAFRNEREAMESEGGFGPPRDHGYGIVSDAASDAYPEGAQLVQARIASPPSYTPTHGQYSTARRLQHRLSSPTRPRSNSPQTSAIQRRGFISDNAHNYNPVLRNFLNLHLRGPLRRVEPIPGGRFVLDDGTIADEQQLNDAWNPPLENRPSALSPPQKEPIPVDETAERDFKKRCEVRPHLENIMMCPRGTSSHHIMMDSMGRLGNREEAQRGDDPRAPGFPGFFTGQTVCLPQTDHNNLHGDIRRQMAEYTAGTIPAERAKEISFRAIENLPNEALSPLCKKIAIAASEKQLRELSAENERRQKEGEPLYLRAAPKMTEDLITYFFDHWGLNKESYLTRGYDR